MAEISHSSDPRPSIFPSSPKISSLGKTLDDSSPTAPIRALVVQSLALSSPIRQIQASSPVKSFTQIQNPDESSSSPPVRTPVSPPSVLVEENERRESQITQQTQISSTKTLDESSLPQIQISGELPSSPLDKTLVPPPSVNAEENEGKDSQIMQQNQISSANYNNVVPIASTSYSLDASRDSYNNPPRRYIANVDYQSNDGFKVEPRNPVEVPWSYPKIEPTGVGAGLDNSGNTCFIASVLQCFTHTVPLIESLRSYNYQIPCNCGNGKFCVMQTLRDHIELSLRSSGYNLSIDQFRDNLNHFSSDFQINHQEDAHEFLQSFLDKLERCCLNPRNNPGSISPEDVNIVDHVFGGRLRSRLHCCNCNSFSDTFEPSLGWSLEIEDVDNLWSALESFTCVEKLEDQFTCDNCKEKVSKEKQLKIDKLPPVATFHLKRFKNDGVAMEKIFKHVRFPLELDLLPYMSNSDENPEVSTKYHLYAFVEHLGNGVSFGHYTSYVRSAPGTWHNFDDAKVMKLREECVLTQDAYILFYAREGTKWFSTSFEELKPVFEATPLNFSPKSVLETTCREECAADHSYYNVGNTNNACNGSVEVPTVDVKYMDYQCDEPKEEVFHSMESSSDGDDDYRTDALESPKAADENERPFAETSPKEEPKLYPSVHEATTNDNDANVHVSKIQKQDASPKRKGSFQIQRSHLQTKKKQEESRGTKAFRNIDDASAADPNGKGIAVSYLRRNPGSSRARMLAAALGSSPIKKKNIRRLSNLHRRL